MNWVTPPRFAALNYGMLDTCMQPMVVRAACSSRTRTVRRKELWLGW